LLIQLNNSSEECTFSANANFPNSDIKETVINLFNNLSIQYTEIELPAKSALSLNESDLKLLINKKVEYSGVIELSYGLVALSLAIKKMGLIAEEEFHHQFDISEYSFGAFLKMDTAAMNCLNLFSLTNMSANTKKIIGVDSIFTLLDKTSNKMGRRLLKKWMKQPLTDIKEINKRLDIVQSFIKNDTMCVKVRKILSKVPDVQVLAAKLFKIKIA
jgi:DNA mismatch repair protein MSH2